MPQNHQNLMEYKSSSIIRCSTTIYSCSAFNADYKPNKTQLQNRDSNFHGSILYSHGNFYVTCAIQKLQLGKLHLSMACIDFMAAGKLLTPRGVSSHSSFLEPLSSLEMDWSSKKDGYITVFSFGQIQAHSPPPMT